ncbi:hypothetical protein [[Kitasatospora] papulosa]|uniref:hypothetical protein n=1 Tax=[Kitasatospora] papulosa TaxID=1464011 RepID=UPI0036ABAB84
MAPDTDTPNYQIRAFNAEGEGLRLADGVDGPDTLTADTVFTAVALLAAIPATARMLWEDGQVEYQLIAQLELWHHSPRSGSRGRACSSNLLETITRIP